MFTESQLANNNRMNFYWNTEHSARQQQLARATQTARLEIEMPAWLDNLLETPEPVATQEVAKPLVAPAMAVEKPKTSQNRWKGVSYIQTSLNRLLKLI